MTKITLRRHHSADTWAAARQEYLLGVSAVEVCERHQIGLSTFHRRAAEGGWHPSRMTTPAADPNGLYHPSLPVWDNLDPEPGDEWGNSVTYTPVDLTDPEEAEELAKLAWINGRDEAFRGRLSTARGWMRLHREMAAIAKARALAQVRTQALAEPEDAASVALPVEPPPALKEPVLQEPAVFEPARDEETPRDGFSSLVERRSDPFLDAVEPAAFRRPIAASPASSRPAFSTLPALLQRPPKARSMFRPLLLAALLASTAPSAYAESAPAAPPSVTAQAAVSPPPSLTDPVAMTIPAVVDKPWPGVVRLDVDATDLNRRIYRVHETIPVEGAGPLTLFFPAWLPGDHGPDGPITQLAGLIFTANGQRLEWTRDPVESFAFHIVVPQGATEISADFQHLSPTAEAQGRVTMTAEMLNAQWEKMLLYPAGRWHRNITTQASIKLPTGWNLGTALETASTEGDTTTFKPVTLDVLVDSPLMAGVHYRRIDLDPGGRSPVNLDIFADSAANIAPTDEQIGILRQLVVQADRLFGARHFDHYDFLMAMTDRLGGIGLEHHRSSEDSVDPAFFTDWANKLGDRDLLAHEYTHSWNGKWRRPAGQYVANYNTPLQNELLWVYEGQTQFWGKVLAARSGLMTREQALDALAMDAATFDNREARDWRALQDTVNDPIISMRQPKGWLSWQRDEDYYVEGQLIWLDADTLIREKTNGRKGLDDFAKAFFGTHDGRFDEAPYRFEDVVAALNGVVAHDWATFLRTRLDGTASSAPLDGLTRGGYRLVYTDTKSPWQKTLEGGQHRNAFTYSLGFVTNETNAIGSVQWDSPAFKAGLAVGMQIVAVNGDTASAARIADAITAAKGTTAPIELIVKDGDHYRTVRLDYHDGLRYPHLERIPGTPDRLGALYAARRN